MTKTVCQHHLVPNVGFFYDLNNKKLRYIYFILSAKTTHEVVLHGVHLSKIILIPPWNRWDKPTLQKCPPICMQVTECILKHPGISSKMGWWMPCQQSTWRWKMGPQELWFSEKCINQKNFSLLFRSLKWKSGNESPGNSSSGISVDILFIERSLGFLQLPVIRSRCYPWQGGHSSRSPLHPYQPIESKSRYA